MIYIYIYIYTYIYIYIYIQYILRAIGMAAAENLSEPFCMHLYLNMASMRRLLNNLLIRCVSLPKHLSLEQIPWCTTNNGDFTKETSLLC